MRIGEVNKDNYKFFLQMMGAKSSKALDALMEDGIGGKKTKELTQEERDREMIKMGFAEEGMIIHEGDDMSKYNWNVTIPNDVKDKIIAITRRQFLENGNGMNKEGGIDSAEIGKIMKEYRKNVPVNDRLAVTSAITRIYGDEMVRLDSYVKKMDPTWRNGQKFDPNILLKSNFGTNTVDVKV